MSLLEDILGSAPIIVNALASFVLYGVIVVAVWKIFSISSEVGEIKKMVRELKHSAEDRAVAALVANPQSPESLVRAVNAAEYRALPDEAAALPVEPERLAK